MDTGLGAARPSEQGGVQREGRDRRQGPPSKLISLRDRASQASSLALKTTARPPSGRCSGQMEPVWGWTLGGGVFKEAARGRGLCCHGDLAALRAKQAPPPASGRWASAERNRPSPGLLSFVRGLNYRIWVPVLGQAGR